MARIPVLRDLILKAKHAWCYSGQQIMSDDEVDALENKLRALALDDAVLALVGSPKWYVVQSNVRVPPRQLPYPRCSFTVDLPSQFLKLPARP
jgi:hypothetical protein